MKRIFWPLALAFVGLVGAFAHLDRQARMSPAYAALVPQTFGGFSLEQDARSAIQSGDARGALATARKLVAARPIPAEHLAMLARAEALAGEENSAIISIQRAAHRSWRDAPTQQAMLALAVDAGDKQEAARRLAALWAVKVDREKLERLSQSLLDDPDTRRAFDQILGQRPRWETRFRDWDARRKAAAR